MTELNKLIKDGYILKSKHPSVNYYIYNYSLKTQFERQWNNYTLMCRGLIMDSDNNIIARPFSKFFNIEELEYSENINYSIPNESFEVYEKLDGSLGILYWIDNKPYLATRGSFESEQSKIGTKILYDKYSHIFDKLDKSITYLFEIIYPDNRIVINYGELKDIFLLAMIDTKTGKDIDLVDIGFPVVKKYDGINDFKNIRELYDSDNKEGFVIKFKSGFRLKLKFEEYKRLHRLITHTSPKHVWELLKSNDPIDKLLEDVPDEFYSWVHTIIDELNSNYNSVELQCKKDFKDNGDRKLNALYYQKCKYPSVLFKMLDNREYSDIIWKLIKPNRNTVFKVEI